MSDRLSARTRAAARGVWGGGFLLVCAWLVACRTGDSVPESPVRDGGLTERPPATVVTDFDGGPLGDAVGPPVGSPISGGGTRDAGWGDAPDAPRADAADAPDAAPVCNVLLQNCGPQKGCYLTPAGEGVCEVAGDFGANIPCTQHNDCAPRYLCADTAGPGTRQCVLACSVAEPESCPKGDVCRKFAGSLGICVP